MRSIGYEVGNGGNGLSYTSNVRTRAHARMQKRLEPTVASVATVANPRKSSQNAPPDPVSPSVATVATVASLLRTGVGTGLSWSGSDHEDPKQGNVIAPTSVTRPIEETSAETMGASAETFLCGPRLIVGIDPGLSGALAFLGPNGDLAVHDMPIHRLARGGKAKRELDLVGLARLIDVHAADVVHAFIEQVGAMPGQGVSGVFAFGKAYGAILGVLAANFVPLTLVAPGVWKRALGVPAAKDGARARASQLLPRAAGLWPLAKHDGRAEAALIALYGARQLGRVAP